MSRKKTIEELRLDVQKVHGDKYFVPYQDDIRTSKKIRVKCLVDETHGEFLITPNQLLRPRGCPICAGNIRKTFEEFEEEATILHEGEYYYPYQKLENTRKLIAIGCYEHGIFMQSPHDHLTPRGCPECGGTKKHTFEQVLKISYEIHHNRYFMPEQEYVNKDTKMKLICEEHGEFWQTMRSHIGKRSGCPHCFADNKFMGYNEEKYFVPFIKQQYQGKRIITQYIVQKPNNKGCYFVDIGIPELKIFFEYDEYHHRFEQEEDKIRQDYIHFKFPDYKIIRVDDRQFMTEILTEGKDGSNYLLTLL